MHTLEIPANVEEAITIRRMLDAEPTAQALQGRYGEAAVAATHSNAMNWVYARHWQGYDPSDYERHEPREWIIHAPTEPDGEARMEETEIDVRPEPINFDAQQRKIILSAMRQTVRRTQPYQPEDTRAALDYLAQRSPHRLERLLSRVALERMMTPSGDQRLVQYLYARVTRGRNRPYRLAAIAAGPRNYHSDVRYRKELPERA